MQFWFTSEKSQTGEGVRRILLLLTSFTDGEPLGSSGMTANRPRCKHGDCGPYVTATKYILMFEQKFRKLND